MSGTIQQAIEFVYAQLTNAASNQFLSGGLVLGAIGAVGMSFRRLPQQLWRLFLQYCTVIVDVQNNAPAYTWLLYWLETQGYSKTSRRVSVKHIRLKNGEYTTILVPARGNHWFFYEKRPLWLVRSVDKEAAGAPGSAAEFLSALDPKETISIRMLGRSRNTANGLIESARALYETSTDGLLHVHRHQWGSWKKVTKPKRPIESIFFPDGGKDILLDMRQFMDQHEWYMRMGIPYRRGYLFAGPPGTGKSSSAEALAGELGVPVYVLNLAGMSDGSLETAFANIDNTGVAMLLIEDVDTVLLRREKTTESQKLSLGTLLNVLDGIQAIDNVILVMTSNNPDALDAALTRKGRIDKTVYFGLASEEQINMAVKRFLPQTTLEQCREITTWPRPLSMADVQEYLKAMVVR